MVGALSRISSVQDEREKLWADWALCTTGLTKFGKQAELRLSLFNLS